MNKSSAAGAGRESLGRLQIGRNRVIQNLTSELVAQDDQVLAVPRQKLLLGVPGIPNPGFGHEVEPGAVDHRSTFALRVGAEEDRRSEDPLEGSDQAAILRTTLLHAEGVQHLGCAIECNPRCPVD